MSIILPTEISEKDFTDKIYLFLYAKEKFGKSSFASQFPDHLFIDLEDALRFLRVRKIPCYDWNRFEEIVSALEKQEYKDKYKTIIIDTIDTLFKILSIKIAEKAGVESLMDVESKGGFNKGYGLANTAIFQQLYKIIKSGYSLIAISHAKQYGKKTKSGNIDRFGPNLSETTRNEVLALFDIILYGSVETVTKSVDGKFQEKKVRVWNCYQSDEFHSGDRSGLVPGKFECDKESFGYKILIEALNRK